MTDADGANEPLARLSALLRRAQGRRTQAELVKTTGLAKATVSAALGGKSIPQENTLEALTDALGMPDADILEAFRLRRAASPPERRLAAYLRAARLAAQEHPYPGVVPGTIPPLAAVYLRQHMTQIDSTESGERTDRVEAARRGREGLVPGAADDGRAMLRDWQVPLSAEQALAGGHSSVILSGPGGGKSSLLRTLLTEQVDSLIATHEGPAVPVLVPAAALVDTPLAQAIASAVNKDLSTYGLIDELPASFFASPAQMSASPDPKAPPPSTGWLVLIDGFDEITDRSSRERVLRTVANVSTEPQGLYRFILATRPLPAGELGVLPSAIPRYDLLQFRPEDVEKVAHSWFRALAVPNPEIVAVRFCLALERTKMVDLARIPLMIAMLCQIHTAAPDLPLPAGRGRIYARFVELLHERQHESRRSTTAKLGADLAHYPGAFEVAQRTLANLGSLVSHLAAERFAGNLAPSLDIIASHSDAEHPDNVPPDVWRSFLHANLNRTGLLTTRGGDLAFLHQTLLEYLAAWHAGKDPGRTGKVLSEVFDSVQQNSGETTSTLRALSQSSFVGFLIDTADPKIVADHLARIVDRASGLRGCEFIAQQVELGTRIPDSIVRDVTDRCGQKAKGEVDYGRLVFKALLSGIWFRDDLGYLTLKLGALARIRRDIRRSMAADDTQYRSAVVLTRLGDDRGFRLLESIATDLSTSPNGRLRAVKQLVEIASTHSIDCVDRIISDGRNPSWFRVSCAEILAGVDAAKGGPLLLGLARSPELGARSRVAAANSLVKLDDPRGPDLLGTLATDDSLDVGSRRQAAKLLLVNRDNPRKSPGRQALFSIPTPDYADLLHAVALESDLDDRCRMDAAAALSDLDDPRGSDRLNDIALDTKFTLRYRLRSAARLTELLDGRGADRLAEIAGDAAVGAWRRLRAAELLSVVDDVRARDFLYVIASDEDLDRKVRTHAAMLLANLGDRRSVGLMKAVARDSSQDGNARVEAADLVVEFSDEGGLELLAKLARNTSIDGWLRTRAAQLAAKHQGMQSTDLLYALARDQSLNKAAQGAAEELARLGDPRGANILAALAGRRSSEFRNRLDAAEALAALGDPRGPDLLYALATRWRSSDPGGRVEAAKALAAVNDDRGVRLLNDFATRRLTLGRLYRWQADIALADLDLSLPKGHYFLYFFRYRITTHQKDEWTQ